MRYVLLSFLGAVVAFVFDWATAYSANLYRLPTKADRWKATIVSFSIHGPWGAIVLPLFLSGLLAQSLVTLGMAPGYAGLAALPLVALIAFVAMWCIRQLPFLRRIRADVEPALYAGHAQSNRAFGRLLGYTPSSGGKDR